MKDDLKFALESLRRGGVILYPTDTIWGLGCDATNEEAVKKIYAIKQRKDEKSMLILIDEAQKLTQYMAEVPEIAWDLLEVTNKPITIIFPDAQNIAGNLVAEDGSIGIRVVKDEFCHKLIRTFGKPIVSTSANISGTPWPVNFHMIDEKIIKAVDYVVKWRRNDEYRGKPSGIIKLGRNGEVKVIRE